jgi:hypothetical protein
VLAPWSTDDTCETCESLRRPLIWLCCTSSADAYCSSLVDVNVLDDADLVVFSPGMNKWRYWLLFMSKKEMAVKIAARRAVTSQEANWKSSPKI